MMTERQKKISKAYFIYMELMVAIGIGLFVFNLPMNAYQLGQFVGPTLGEIVFYITHPNPLGQMEYVKA